MTQIRPATLSPDLQALLDLPDEERHQAIEEMGPEAATALVYDWHFWARPDQLAPEGKWFLWLLLGGRGGGKTRAGSEWIRERVTPKEKGGQGKARRIALVGESAADVRDIMVEGEAGILAVSPPWFRPLYEPSKRRLTWPNGAVGTCYSGDKPALLRGPSHDTAWCDETCLSITSKVACERGAVPIAEVRPGERVWTRRGLRVVTAAWETDPSAEVWEVVASDGRRLVGTAGHPVWVEGRGFVPLRFLQDGDILKVWQRQESSGVESTGGSIPASAATTATARGNSYTGRSGRMPMGPSRKDAISTTRTAVASTTHWRISNSSRRPNTARSIPQRDGQPGTGVDEANSASMTGAVANRRLEPAPLAEASLRAVGCEVSTAAPPVRRAPTPADTCPTTSVSSAESTSQEGPTDTSDSVPASVSRLTSGEPVGQLNADQIGRARFAESHSMLAGARPKHAPKPVDTNSAVRVLQVRGLPSREAVYNLEVEGEHEFFANGILTHNCKWRRPDEAMAHLELGLRLGDDPRGVITTTPRPIPLIRRLVKDPGVHVTHSITYDNIANLAQRFIERVIQRHEGTRLGRQELHAEILEDTPGALWSHEIIEAHRIPHTRCPYDKIVIGVDPQAHETDPESRTHDEEAGLSETGIVVCARGARDHHGYVLWDYSGYYSPRDWAEKAKAAFFKFHANWVVAEVNHGGAMVVYTIRSVDDRVAVKPVRASLGKRARAEPIASLYEQGRVHHVGQWAELEDQMCTWTDGEGWHADRMDALVWALTELLIEDHQDDTPFGEYDATRHTFSVPTGQRAPGALP